MSAMTSSPAAKTFRRGLKMTDLLNYGKPESFGRAVAVALATTGLTEAEYVLMAQKFEIKGIKRFKAYRKFYEKEGYDIVELEKGRFVEKQEPSRFAGSLTSTDIITPDPTKIAERENVISINRMSIEKLFSVGDDVQSGGGRKYFSIIEISDDYIRIKATEASRPKLSFQKISAVINNFHTFNPNRIEASVYAFLLECGLKETSNEVYFYGFAKEFLSRSGGVQSKIDVRRSEDAKDIAVNRMAKTALDTVDAGNGQQILRTVKNKELRFPTQQDFEKHITELVDAQDGLCAITSLVLQFEELADDQELLCSLDRIDSDGHYEPGNLQVVCRFVNRWKSDGNDAEFRRLLSLLRNSGTKEDAQLGRCT
ncbi:MAG: hypothetical protein JJE30_16010 [Desulfuromonadales bacterium]|nr:hypothetical protein [Desulfuromonadales bacterium]